MSEPFVTYLELRESTPAGEAGAGLSHKSGGLVLLHVLELAAYGEPRGAVTVVHDAGEHGGRYLPLARRLAERGWSVALPDLRGHGRSEGERGDSVGLREVFRDLGDVQDHLAYRQPEAPRVLVGRGLGALYCLAFATEHPDGIAALVLLAPVLEPQFVRPEGPTGLFKMLKKLGPGSPGRIGWKAEDLAADEFLHDVITLRAIEQAEEAARTYRTRGPELSMPTLVIQGGRATRTLSGPRIEAMSFGSPDHDPFREVGSAEVIDGVLGWLDSKLPR
ncbi:MAG: alpha/beta fold hydrolase [Planctomycetota bacterium]